MFVAEFTDSRTKPNPARIIPTFLCLPLIESSDSTVIAKYMELTSTKEVMKSTEIMTTILATFRFRLETLSACTLVADFCRHFAVF